MTIEDLYEKWLKTNQLGDNSNNRKKVFDFIKELVNLQQIEIVS